MYVGSSDLIYWLQDFSTAWADYKGVEPRIQCHYQISLAIETVISTVWSMVHLCSMESGIAI